MDTFFCHEIPNLRGMVEKDGKKIQFVSVHTLPALDDFSKKRLDEHLITVEQELEQTGEPLLVVGDFNAVSWSEQLQQFMDGTGLMESRTGFMPVSLSGRLSLIHI